MASTPSLADEYQTLTPLQVRIDTHQNYSEHPDNPNTAVAAALGLTGSEDLVDVGCGDARFLEHLVRAGHIGRLVGVDSSPAMVAAARSVAGVTGVHADAINLPFNNGEFTVCTARHMLYHLTEPQRAIEEFRRITAPGGTVAVTVNHSKTCWRTHELVASRARQLGLREPAGMLNHAVNSDTIGQMMSNVFGNVTLTRHDNALVFHDPAPLLRFAESLASFCGISADDPHRPEILAGVAADIDIWFARHQGQPWRDPKGYTIALSHPDR